MGDLERFIPCFAFCNSRIPHFALLVTLINLIILICVCPISVVHTQQSIEIEAGENQNLGSTYLGYDDIYDEFRRGRCRNCHPAIWREWEKSRHAQAWKNPIYQKAASEIPDREESCDPCHAPQPILITGIGKMPKLREADRDSGVSCMVCHVDSNGGMHGPPASIDAVVHANITDEFHQTPIELCGTCHGQPGVPEYNQLASFKHSPAAKAGKHCATCHMPAIKRLQSLRSNEPILGGRHIWIASRSVDMLQSAADLKISLSENKAVIRISNKSGHALPGGGLRIVVLDVKIYDNSGSVIGHEQRSISAKSGEGGDDNRIQPGVTRQFSYGFGNGAKIEAKLRYRLLPTTPESEWITMAEARQIVQ